MELNPIPSSLVAPNAEYQEVPETASK